MSKDFEKLWKDWENGAKVFLRFTEVTWEIDVEWKENSCVFGKKWFSFAEETNLEVGDTLVLFRIPESGPYAVNVCIFKGKDQIIDEGRGNSDIKVILCIQYLET